MKRCTWCNDELFTDIYDTCMTCFEKYQIKTNMEKVIEGFQKEINALQATVNGDGFNIKRLSEENEKLRSELECYKKNGDVKSDVVQRQKDILDKTLFELPVGSIKNHTYESIPDRVKYYVREYAILDSNQDEANELIEKSIPNFFDHPDAGNILDNTVILLKMANDDKLEAWADREALEALQQEIEVFYEYYAGFGAKKDLTTTQMLNHILQTVPNYKPTKEEYDLEDMKRHCYHYIEALTEITKKNRKAETCRMIALKALGELNHQDHQPELLIEENLKLRMELEDVQSKLADATLEKVFTEESHSLMDCQDCGKFWDYHHEEHCEAKKPKPTIDDIKQPLYMGCVKL